MTAGAARPLTIPIDAERRVPGLLLAPRATLVLLEDADHSWHVPARSGRKDADLMGEALDALASFIGTST